MLQYTADIDSATKYCVLNSAINARNYSSTCDIARSKN